MVGVYHTVCHECPFEELYRSAGTAMRERDSHKQKHEHSVSPLELDRPDPPTEV